ncbi:MAG: PaaI family thioesterase [Actinomycetes bacterium]
MNGPDLHDPDAGRAVARWMAVTLREITAPGGPVTIIGEAPMPERVRDAHGAVHSGVLTAIADVAGGIACGLASLPRWIVSTDLMVSRLRTTVVGPVHVRAEVVRVGRNAAVARVALGDAGAADAPLLTGALTTSLLVPAGGPPDHARPFTMAPPPAGPDPLPGLAAFFRLRSVADGIELDLVDELRNPWGILHGGATAVLVAEAAEHAVRDHHDDGVPRSAGDTVLHYLRPARIGPVVATGHVLGERLDGTLVTVSLRDLGDGSRTTAEAVVTVRPH